MVTAGSQKKVWWKCSRNHEWLTSIASRTRLKSGCPYCAGQKVIAGTNDLKTKNPTLAAEWHPTKNGSLTPDMVTGGSHKKVWWLGKCGHEWNAPIYSRVKGNGCPSCRKKKIGVANRKTNGQFLCELSTINQNIEPLEEYIDSHSKIMCRCKLCNYKWKVSPDSLLRGTGCPFCAGRVRKKVFCVEMNCVFMSISKASKQTKINSGGISSCCHGKQKTAGGYHWKFVEEIEK